jgi:NADP-dependent 3-hydroxy acid dehydrogenase YdfG
MAKQPRVLTGQVAAITGGARGIGRETARTMLAEGMRVAIGDVDFAAVQAAAADLGPPDRIRAYALNVTDKSSFAAFLDGAESDLGPLDVLVNNAGIMQLGSFLEEDDATTRRQIDINVNGVLYGMKLALPGFVARGRGHLVNIASSAGKGGFPGGATYCGTKHFVVGVSEAVRAELRDTPVEVSCVMPVVVKTELSAGCRRPRDPPHHPAGRRGGDRGRPKVPRFDVYVPRNVAAINAVMGLMPRRGRDAIGRVPQGRQGPGPARRRGPPRLRAARRPLRAGPRSPGLQGQGATPRRRDPRPRFRRPSSSRRPPADVGRASG